MGAYATLRRTAQDPLYANGLALVANAALSASLGFFFWMIAARRFNADALGVGAAVVSAATLAALIGKAGFDAAVIRYAPSASAAGVRRVVARALLATLAVTTVAAAGILLCAVLGVPALGALQSPAYATGFVLLALGTGGAWILDAYFISEQRAGAVLLRNLAFNGVKLVVPAVIAYEWGGRAVPLAWGVGLAASLAVAITLLPRRLAAHKPTGVAPERGAFGYAMRNYALNLSEFLPGLLLPILVLHGLGAEENARFFLAWTVATVAFLASKAVAQSAFAALVREAGDARAALAKGLTLSGLLLVPAALVIYVGAPWILALFGPHYVEAAGLLRILALSVVPIIAFNLHLAYLKARDASWELTLLPLVSLALLLPALPFALRWGIEGAGVAWLAVQTALGLYAAARLAAKLKRDPHGTSRTGLRRHPHQG